MKANPSTDVAPIVGLVVLHEGESFQEAGRDLQLPRQHYCTREIWARCCLGYMFNLLHTILTKQSNY